MLATPAMIIRPANKRCINLHHPYFRRIVLVLLIKYLYPGDHYLDGQLLIILMICAYKAYWNFF